MTDLTQLEALTRGALDAALGKVAPSEAEFRLKRFTNNVTLAAILDLIERVRVAEAQVAFNQQTIPMAPEHKATEDMHKSMAEGIRRAMIGAAKE